MISVLDFKNLDLYKNNIYYPMNQGNKNKGTAIFLTSLNVKQSSEMMNDKYVRNKMYYSSYYYANRYNLKLFNENIKINMVKDVTKMFVDMKNNKIEYKNLIKYCYNEAQLTGTNTYVDMSLIYQQFFNIAKRKNKPAINMVREFDKFIKNYISEFDLNTGNIYTNKIMLLNLDVLGIDTKDPLNYGTTELDNLFAIIFYMIRYKLDLFKTLGINILLRSAKYSIVIKPSECDKDSYKLLRTNMLKLKQNSEKDHMLNRINNTDIKPVKINNTNNKLGNGTVAITDLQKDSISDAKESVTDEEVRIDTISKAVSANIIGELKNLPNDKKLSYAFVGNDANGKSAETEIDDKLEKDVEKTVKTLAKENKITKDTKSEEMNDMIKSSLEKNEDFMSNLVLGRNNKLTNMMSPSNLARNKQLAEKQSKVDFKGKTIDQVLNESKDQVIPTKKIKSTIMNECIKDLKLPNFDKIYNEEMYDQDIINIVNSFKNKSIPVYILSIDKKDTSNVFNKKFTWTVSMEAADRTRHKLVFDTPKFINDSFMYLNGNKKNIYKQLFLLPISKTEPDVVQICTNYNKAFIRRLGDKLSPKTERFRKVLVKYPKIKLELGDNTTSNNIAITSLEYDELAKAYNSINITGLSFIFNLPQMFKMCDELKIKRPSNEKLLPVGIRTLNKNKPEIIYLDVDKNIIKGTNISLVDYIVSNLSVIDSNLEKDYQSENVGKKYMYNSVTIMGKAIPLMLLLSYVEGITAILRKSKINHEFSDTRPQMKDNDKNDKGIIEFSDGYLIYDKYPYANSLLLNGLNSIPTKNYSYADLDDRETYLEIFDNLFGAKKLANALDNFYDLLLDPKTIGVLKDLSMPTDFVGVFLYANKLLEDNEYVGQTSANTNRIRSNEIVSAMVYKTLATAYESYRITAGNKNPQKMTIPQDLVLKNILMLNTVEDYSTLGPILEAEKVRAISFKGHSGMNLDRAYTLENRSYDKSMLGVLSMSSPPTGSVGVVRQMPFDSNILSAKGYMKSADSLDDITQANMASPAEQMIPMCTTKDDALRISMANNQSKHVVPCKKYDKLLVGNGADRVFANIISDDFAFKAKEDGTVIDINEESGLMVLQYKSGEKDFVELDAKISKNGGGGFYISNKLASKLSIGSKFKKDDVIASNTSYFQQTSKGEAIYKAGTLTKIALTSGYYTYEDSSLVSEQLCEDMGTEVIMDDDVILGPNSNIDFIAKVGDTVKVGDPLVIYDVSYGDDGINKMLASMDAETSKEIIELGKKKLHASHAGVVENIEVYYTVDLETLSPTLRKAINSINAKIIKKKKTISKYTDPNATNVILPPTDKVDTQFGKVKSITVGEGVYIKFYIKYYDRMFIGDKIVFFAATKSVICDVMPKGKEAFSEYRPEEPLGAFLSDGSMLKRMVGSIEYNLFENKILIELKRQCKEIRDGKRK